MATLDSNVMQCAQLIQASSDNSSDSGRVLQLIKTLRDNCNSDDIARSQEQLDRLHAEKKTLAQLTDELHSVSKEIRKRKEECAALAEYATDMKTDAEIQNKLFQQCCGLEFRITTDRAFALVFTSIVPSDPSRKFKVTLDVVEDHTDSKWALVGMEPSVDGMEELLTKLNKTNDFGQFCKEVRKTLKRMHTQ